jgi:alkylhydroperoxidase family enzyme
MTTRHALEVHSMFDRRCVLAMAILAIALTMPAVRAQVREAIPRVPLPRQQDAWKRLPSVEKGGGGELPPWARALADSLPHTTAAMLELDAAYRGQDELDPKFRAALRWVLARENRSAYGRAVAEADFRRAGGDPSQLRSVFEPDGGWSSAERAAFAFTRKMAFTAHTVTDKEVKHLLDAFGEKRLVAIVLQLAYGNFQDHLTTLLRLPIDKADSQAPLAVQFRMPPGLNVKVPAAARPERQADAAADLPGAVKGEEWRDLDIRRLQAGMEQQRARAPRIRVPSWDEVVAAAPPDMLSRDKPSRIRWSLVVMGYQPRLGPAWLRTIRTFGAEAKQDRVLEESIFWVITRNLQCFY